jgi:hypothetical protein
MEYLAIYIKPSDKVVTELRKYTKKISKIVIKINPLGPHCTIIGSFFKNEKEVLDIIKKLRFEKFRIKTLRYDFFESNNLVIKIKRSQEILELHKKIIDKLKTKIMRPKENKYTTFNSPKRRAIFKKYGNVFLGEFYNPHISIAKILPKLNKSSIRLIEKEYVFQGINWNVDKIYVAKRTGKKWKKIMEIRAN